MGTSEVDDATVKAVPADEARMVHHETHREVWAHEELFGVLPAKGRASVTLSAIE
jgi:hypothetical protein